MLNICQEEARPGDELSIISTYFMSYDLQKIDHIGEYEIQGSKNDVNKG